MENGSVAIASLQQADGVLKNRPVLILCQVPPYEDYLVCGISSQTRLALEGVDIILDEVGAGFNQTGLRCSSVIRTRYLATLPSGSIKGKVGHIPDHQLSQAYQSLERLFGDLHGSIPSI